MFLTCTAPCALERLLHRKIPVAQFILLFLLCMECTFWKRLTCHKYKTSKHFWENWRLLWCQSKYMETLFPCTEDTGIQLHIFSLSQAGWVSIDVNRSCVYIQQPLLAKSRARLLRFCLHFKDHKSHWEKSPSVSIRSSLLDSSVSWS